MAAPLLLLVLCLVLGLIPQLRQIELPSETVLLIFLLLKAESLTNDGTALVLYAIAVGATLGGSYTSVDIAGLFARSYVGGAVAGIPVATAAYLLLVRVRDPLIINVALLITPFDAFLLAKAGHASGVLAVVAAG